MKCPVCGAAELIHDTRDLPYTYKGESTVIREVTGDFCPACAESITDMAETEHVMREIQAFNKQVDATSLDDDYRTMAADEDREAEAMEWCNALAGDMADAAR